MAEYNPSKIIKDGNTYNFRDTTKIPLAGSNQISGSLIPSTDNSIDIGSSTKNIKMLYTKGITINGTQFLPSDYATLSSLSTVATSGSYNDLSNKPTIPTVNNATLTIQRNGATVKTFTANQSTNVTANITVPTKTSDLTNDSGFITSDNTKIPLAGSNQISGDLIPSTDGTVNLGGTSYQWNNAYIKSLTINGVACGDILTHNASEFVNVTSGQTISGQKIFTTSPRVTRIFPDIALNISDCDVTEIPTESKYASLLFRDKNNIPLSYIVSQQRTDGTKRMCLRTHRTDNINSYYSVDLDSNGDFYPEQTNAINLGTPALQWNNAYIKSLTINGVACGDMLTHNVSEFVGITGNQTIAGVKTFSSNIIIQGGKKVTCNLDNSFIELDGGTTWGKGGSIVLSGQDRSSYTNSVLIVSKSDTNTDILQYQNGELKPHQNNTNNSLLGTPTNKWSKVYSDDVVHTTGDETISGVKTFSSNGCKFYKQIVINHDLSYSKDNPPSLSAYHNLMFTDASGWWGSYIENVTDTNGNSTLRFYVRNTNENQSSVVFRSGIDNSYSIHPISHNVWDLGAPASQWKNTYTRNILIDNDINIASSLINKTSSSGVLSIRGGLTTPDGASIGLYGKDYNGAIAGNIYMTAYGNSDYTNFRIYPNGTMNVYNNSTATTKNVAMQEDVIPRSGGAVMTDYFLGRSVDTGSLMISGGTSWSSGGSVEAFGSNHSSYAGRVRLQPALSNSNFKTMNLEPSGTWSWSGTACQITSDQRYKQQITEIDDKLLDAWEDVELVQFKYNDSVDTKGKSARLHTGYVVQQIDSACKSHNVDISEYGLYCHEEYPEETKEVEVEQADGTKTKETRVIREASEHYSLRYTEALIVECKYLRRCIARLTARIEELEKGNNNK